MDRSTETATRTLRGFGALLLLFGPAVGLLAAAKAAHLLVIASVLAALVGCAAAARGGERLAQLPGLAIPGGLLLLAGPAFLGAPTLLPVLMAGGAGVAVGGLCVLQPDRGRAVYDGWTRAAEPIGWVIGRLILGLVFYLVVTPIGLAMRALGRDPMQRRLEPEAETYWEERGEAPDTERYFRQF